MTNSTLRLCDLSRFDTLRVECHRCGRVTEYLPGWLREMGWVRSEGRLADLRFRCEKCQAVDGFRVSIFDERERTSSSPAHEKVILPGSASRR